MQQSVRQSSRVAAEHQTVLQRVESGVQFECQKVHWLNGNGELTLRSGDKYSGRWRHNQCARLPHSLWSLLVDCISQFHFPRLSPLLWPIECDSCLSSRPSLPLAADLAAPRCPSALAYVGSAVSLVIAAHLHCCVTGDCCSSALLAVTWVLCHW